ncbi:hypothetical protein TARUN_9497, partial [Trichoderma arundinaceum]
SAATVVQLCESAGLVGNATSDDPSSTTGASPASTTKSDAGHLSREIGWASAAIGILTAMVIL